MESKTTQIGALAKILGITPRTIRYYEEMGLMGQDVRTTIIRTYGDKKILRLKFILKMKSLGLTLKEGCVLSDIFDMNDHNFSKISPKIIEILDCHISKIEEKNIDLNRTREEIVEYKQCIIETFRE